MECGGGCRKYLQTRESHVVDVFLLFIFDFLLTLLCNIFAYLWFSVVVPICVCKLQHRRHKRYVHKQLFWTACFYQ